ncbi:MAG TPA: FKBP-type peptidyl-prolyl cis-trans isomerase [Pseudonocardiaceae bacterium]|nr:FKBP-type peptidyl-prolyl cis-trans isomerase [Pseudonocardiaceae bacterium]
MRIRASFGVAAACVLALTTTACGSAANSAASGSTGTLPTVTSAPRKPCTVDQIMVTANFGAAPTVTLPKDCTTPTTLLSKDIVAGTGTAVASGDTISADYQLTTWSDGKMLQQSFGGDPFNAQIGVHAVIPGWDQGLIGMKANGRRLLVVPPALGYGNTPPAGIKANETLVFVIDVHSVS